jgi:hypothetical protein
MLSIAEEASAQDTTRLSFCHFSAGSGSSGPPNLLSQHTSGDKDHNRKRFAHSISAYDIVQGWDYLGTTPSCAILSEFELASNFNSRMITNIEGED